MWTGVDGYLFLSLGAMVPRISSIHHPFLWYGLLAPIYVLIGPWSIGAAVSLSLVTHPTKKLTKKRGLGSYNDDLYGKYIDRDPIGFLLCSV